MVGRNTPRGFTLVSLAVTAMVIGSLTAVAVPTFRINQASASVAVVAADLKNAARVLDLVDVRGTLSSASELGLREQGWVKSSPNHYSEQFPTVGVFSSPTQYCATAMASDGTVLMVSTQTYGAVVEEEPTAVCTPLADGSGPWGLDAGDGAPMISAPPPARQPPLNFVVGNAAVFAPSGQTLQLTNSTRVSGDTHDGFVYTNGNLNCNSSAYADAVVVVRGNVTISNSCRIRSLWVSGSVYTSGTTAVLGTIMAGGNLVIGNSGLTITGNVALGGAVLTQDGGTQSFGGQLEEQVSDLPTFPTSSFPSVPADRFGPVNGNYAAWLDGQARANNAPSWVNFLTNPCQTWTEAQYSLNGPLLGPATDTVFDARACAVSVNGLSGQPFRFRLRSDVTLLVKSFSSSNGIAVTSADGQQHTLRIVVPWSDATGECGNSGAGSIVFNSGGVSFAPQVRTLLYTPGTVQLSNQTLLYGQVYGCQLLASNTVTINYSGGTSGLLMP